MDAHESFFDQLRAALEEGAFVKLTLSKPRARSAEWRNTYARLIELKGRSHFSFTHRYEARDETHNFAISEGLERLREWLGEHFLIADLFTLGAHWNLQLNKKGHARLKRHAAQHEEAPAAVHDQPKERPLPADRPRPYLAALGITGKDGQILKKGQRKFRQINKYMEIIGHLLEERPPAPEAHIVDMGSGKGYLTFALYDYLVNERGLAVRITGVELRAELVDQSNQLAREQGFERLGFVSGDIHDFQPAGGIDMLIALHACDTATDEALAKGIAAGADIIVVAPCCHKQVRKAMAPPAPHDAILRYGSLLERQAELLTDGIRALLLEARGYKTKVFEFIGTEHTPKNLMITATRSRERKEALAEVAALKATYGIAFHHLERLLTP